MWLTTLALRRPVFIWMVVGALIVLGLRALTAMQVELNPHVDFPFISIQTAYPGAGPAEVETAVTRVIEDAVAGVNGVKLVASRSQNAYSIVNVEFKAGVSSHVAASDLRERIAAVRAELPRDVKQPVLVRFDVNTQPVLSYGLTGRRSLRDVREIANNVIKPRLARLPGVGEVSLVGGELREIRVDVDKARLDAYGLDVLQISAQLKAANLNAPVGRIVERDREYDVRVIGEFLDVQSIATTRLHLTGGSTIRLSDVANVHDGTAERREISRVNGTEAVALIVRQASDANTLKVAHAVREEMSRLRAELPADVGWVVNQDASAEVEQVVADFMFSLVLGSALAVLVVFLFLRSLHGTLIVAITIPTSILATFLPMYFLGFSINTITLLALSLSVGILVDDSIVVLENISRHLVRGEGPVEAAINGRQEIGSAAVTITLVDVVVFLPLAFMEGITGQFFWPFGLTVGCATLASLFISFTLTPLLAARWYRPRRDLAAVHDAGGYSSRPRPRLSSLYGKALQGGLRFRGIVVYAGTGVLLLLVAVLVASIFPLMAGLVAWIATPLFVLMGLLMLRPYRRVGWAITAGAAVTVLAAVALASGGRPVLLFRFAPGQDQGQVQVTGEMPAGSSLDRTLAAAKRVEQAAEVLPDVESVLTTVGRSSVSAWGLENVGPQHFAVRLKLRPKVSLADSLNPFANTSRMRRRSDTDVADDLRSRIASIPATDNKVSAQSGFYAVGRPLQVNILGRDDDELAALGARVLAAFKAEPGVLNADLSTRPGDPEQRIIVDREKAASQGLSIARLAGVMRGSLEGDDGNLYREDDREYVLRVRLSDSDRSDTRMLPGIVVKGSASGPEDGTGVRGVRLADVARVTDAVGPARLDRIDRQRMVSITADVAPGYAPGNLQVALNGRLSAMDLGANTWKWDGENRIVLEEGQYVAAALALSIVLVYILMAALFESLAYPLVIMCSLPQALVGAVVGLSVAGHALTIVSMVGIIMLMGLVTKNAILLVDCTVTLRARGLSRDQAIIEAGRTRLRPILMTTLAMVLGMLPTALQMGRGSEFRAPLATAVIGGLILSTMLTLLVIPCVYTYFDDLAVSLPAVTRHRLWRSRFVGRRRRGGEPSKESVADAAWGIVRSVNGDGPLPDLASNPTDPRQEVGSGRQDF
jgi:hydrophobic/amphiphilic exporter-1 (mainly G- bacteria), HAE1 family